MALINRIKCEGHGVQLLRDEGLGVVQARNMALEKDMWKNKYCLRIDDDSICDGTYIERLYSIISKDEKIGAVSGVVPLFGQPEFKRENRFVKPIFNKIELDAEGHITKFADDGGYSYMEGETLPAHHLRSSFMFRRELYDKCGIKFEGTSPSGFREESYWSLRVLMAGYKLFVNTDAKCWHLRTESGGVRAPDYAQKIQMDDELFKRWVKEKKDKLWGKL